MEDLESMLNYKTTQNLGKNDVLFSAVLDIL